MMIRVVAGILSVILGSTRAAAELDLDREVLVIPDTHNAKPYIWHVAKNPRGYELFLSESADKAGGEGTFAFQIVSPSGIRPENVHVFIASDDLHAYAHLRALWKGGGYQFSYRPPGAGAYRLEIVFQTPEGWVNLSKSIKMGGPAVNASPDTLPGDDYYHVKVKLLPKKAYAEHVVTFLYEIFYNGAPMRDIEKLDGFDMQVAAWDETLKEFIYMTPKQNMGGPEVAVSVVFMRPGKHAVFAEFKHKGYIRRVDFAVTVYPEPVAGDDAIINLKPSD